MLAKVISNKAYKATNGRKTYVTAFMFLLMSVLGDKVPFLRENEEIIRQVLEYALQLGVLHKMFKWTVKNGNNIKDWSLSNLKLIINKIKLWKDKDF